MRRGLCRLLFALHLNRLGWWLWPTPPVEPLRPYPGGGWISGPMNGGPDNFAARRVGDIVD